MATLTYGSVVGAGPGWTAVDTPDGVKTVYGDRATRNNNPGNIEAGAYANSAGAIGTDGRFAVFGSRLTGTRAQAGLIFGSRYANLTLREAISKYAPEFENNSAAYAAAVAAAAGVSLDTKMKDIPADKRAAVVSGMQAVEGNTGAKAYDQYGNLVDTIDTTSPATPRTAPTPYGPNSSQALGATRPDNVRFSGPLGSFNVDAGVASPIGHVSRSPLGPVAPSRTAFSGLGTPRGVNVASAPSSPSVSGSFTSQDEKTNTGSYKNAPNAGNFTSQDERASFAERMGIPGAVAPSASPPSPTRPDNLSYTGPKGIFSVDPAANVKMDIAPATLGPAAPVGIASVAAPTRPAIAPVPAAAVPKPAVVAAPVAPPTQSYSRQSLAPARPALSAADVYGGAVGTAQTTTPGTTVSRANSYGPTYTTNQYGAVTATAPDGTQMAAWGGVPASKPAIAGPLNNTGIATPAPTTGGMFGPKAKAATGLVSGAALGGFALGPLGAMLGGLIGKNLAMGKAPLAGVLGNSAGNAVGTHTVNTFQGPMSFANAKGGLGFPSAPSAPGGYNPSGYGNRTDGGRGLSDAARSAIDAGGGGLY